MIHPSRSRHSPAGRILAVWLIAAQMVLFSAAGLTHSHGTLAGAGSYMATLVRGAAGSGADPRWQAADETHRGGASNCAICQVARTTVASIAAADRIAPLAILCQQAASDLPVFLPAPPNGPCSARAPPTA